MTAPPLLTDADVTTLNAARTILRELDDTLRTRDATCGADDEDSLRGHWNGRLAERAYTAGAALTGFLIGAKTYGDFPLTEDQLHNRKADPAEWSVKA